MLLTAEPVSENEEMIINKLFEKRGLKVYQKMGENRSNFELKA